MTTAVRHYLIVAIATTTLAFMNMARAGSVSLIDEDNAGDGSRFDSATNTVVSTDADNDLDVCRTFLDGKTEIILPNASSNFTHAHLVMRSFDVDENAQPAQGYPFPEQDNVIFNNLTLGYLSGEYQRWSSSVFPVAAEYVHGQNLVEVDVDVQGQQQNPPNALWCVVVDWGQLVLDGGAQDGAQLTSMSLTNTLKAGDDISLQVQAEVLAKAAGDYLLELSLVDPAGHVIATVDSGSNLYAQSAQQSVQLNLVHSYHGLEFESGYYSLQGVLYEVGVTQNNVWPRAIQDMAIHFFYHEKNAQPLAQTWLDSDGDTLLDHIELDGDQDGDGIINRLDADDDGDGISTRYEHQTLQLLTSQQNILNTDGDARLNYLDTDDDDDGKLTADEGPWKDTDNDGVLDFLDAADDNPCFPSVNHNLCDLDNDKKANGEDSDVDGDGISNTLDSDSYPPVLVDLIIPVVENTLFVVDFFPTDLDADGDVQTYQLLDGLDANLFEINAATGVVHFIEKPDFDDGVTEYEFRMTVTANGKSATALMRVVLENVDDELLQAVTDIDERENSILENAGVGTEVGVTANAIDADGDVVTYRLLTSHNDLFTIDAQTGVITLAQSGRLNVDQQPTYSLDVEAKSTADSGTQQTQFDIRITEFIPDVDNDGVPDSIDPDTSDPCNPDTTSQQCQASGGDGNNGDGNDQGKSTDPEGKLGTGNDGVGSINGWMLILLSMVFLRKKAQRICRVRLSHRALASALVSVVVGSSAVQSQTWFDEMDLYAAAGAGASQLNPDTSGTDYEVDGNSSNSWKLALGWDWTDNLAFEGYYTQLGEASFKQGGTLKYSGMGASAVYQYWLRGSAKAQGSVSMIAKAGANRLTNEGQGVRYEKNSLLQPLFSFGAEYVLPRQWSVRGELELFASDATVFSLNAVKRFGFRSKNKAQPSLPTWEQWGQSQQAEPAAQYRPVSDVLISEADAMAMIQALPPTAAIRERAITIDPIIHDQDWDGVLDDEDLCNNTPSALKVDKKGCAAIEGIQPNVNFINNSTELTKDSRSSLVQIAHQLQQLPHIVIEVQGHTDNQGNEKLNLALSQGRAQSVADALIKAGVPAKQLIVRGYGELMPIASNLTKDGQALNQRIELYVLDSAR